MSETAENVRTFIAVSLPGPVKQELKQLQARVKKMGVHASWPRPEAFHLTLKFLGDVSLGHMGSIQRCMEKAASQSAGFQLKAQGLGIFPSVKRPRVIWAGVGGRTDLLEQVFNNLEKGLAPLGFQKQGQRFSPHFTLARVKHKTADPVDFVRLIRECSDVRSMPFSVATIDLYKSRLTSRGAIHEKLFEARIGKR